MPSPPIPTDSPLLTQIQIRSTQIPKAWISPICGAGAGLASGIVTCPLDVIKTKLQAQGGFTKRSHPGYQPSQQIYKGIIGTARVIWTEDGVRGMYRGLGPMLLGYLPTWAVYLTVYENTRETYYDMCGSWWIARCYSSLTAGACSTLLTNPIWVIKTRLMSQSSTGTTDGMRAPFHYTSTLDAARKMYRAEGLRAFYSGLTPAMLGLTHVAVQFPLYEWFKMKFTGYGMGEHPADGNSHFVGISAATFLSKVCASTATYPHEVVRTRLQTQQRRPPVASSDGMAVKEKYKGVIDICRTMVREEGWRAFYAGIGTNLVRAVPAAMTTMLTYEYLQKLFKSTQAEGERHKHELGHPSGG
jgi:solute carrier family 25 (mitochondrial folate transporter), member 32